MSLKELAIERARKINEQTAAEHAEREAEHLTRLTEKTKELFTDAFPDCVPFVEADGVTRRRLYADDEP